MTNPDTDTLPPFDACWLAEAVRLHALDARPAGGAISPASSASLDEASILQVTQRIAREQGFDTRARQWHRHARLLLALLGVVAVAGGFSAGLSFFGSETRSVNVLWMLVGLLGVHTVALLFWLIGGQVTGGLAGRLWFWLLQHWPAGGQVSTSGTDPLGRALLLMLGRDGLGRWLLGAITHGLWLLALGASLLAVLGVLSLRSVAFTLETTILPAGVFAGFVEGFGWLPSLLGFAIPETAMIQAALAGEMGGELAMQTETAGRAWASWLAGGMLVYGILPRMLAFLVCQNLHRRRSAQCRPDLLQPGYRLLPGVESVSPGVIDPAPPAPPAGQVAALHRVHSSGALLIGLEMGADMSWPPRGMRLRPEAHVEERVDSREQRRAMLARLKAAPPARLLLTLDARLSPDRGTLRWIVDISHFAGELRLLLLPQSAPELRHEAWRESLASIGLSSERVFTDATAAGDWLIPHD